MALCPHCWGQKERRKIKMLMEGWEPGPNTTCLFAEMEKNPSWFWIFSHKTDLGQMPFEGLFLQRVVVFL